MLLHKDRIFFLFGVLRPAKHKRQWDHNLQEAHFLKCFDRCSDYIITSRKTRVEVANSGKTMPFYERSELFRKYPKTPVFDHSNYRLFERIPAVPSTSNNWGLTVYSIYFREMTGFAALVNGEGEVTDFIRLQNLTKRVRSWREKEREEKVRYLRTLMAVELSCLSLSNLLPFHFWKLSNLSWNK